MKEGSVAARKKKKRSARARRPAARKSPARKAAAKKPSRKVARRAADNPLAAERRRLARNKRLVLEFYEQMIGRKDPEAARRYMREPYIQHSPYAEDGFEGVAAFARQFKRDFPNHTYEVKRVIAEGDYVVLHLLGKNGLSPHGEAVIDIFRVENGKVAEHWDVIQSLPENSRNPNGPF
jgi:predicted SnoaL-like aldol condensation-catalyzing enzyme